MNGEFIRKKRKEKNLSIRQLAKLADCHYSTIQKYENNEIKTKGESFFKILKALNLTEEEMKELNIFTELETNKNSIILENTTLDFSGLNANEIKDIKKYIDYIKYKKIT